MSLGKNTGRTGEWLKGNGPDGDIVLSSRVRLARNVAGHPFFHWADDIQRKSVRNLCHKKITDISLFNGSTFVDLSDLGIVDLKFLIERHLMGPEHAKEAESKGLCVDQREILSILVNEEDHLRVQVMQSGFNLQEAWRIASKADEELKKNLEFAFSPRWGYLTACPTNVGTGLRASVMLHLPALSMSGQIQRALEAITKLGLAVRGLHGEGTKASGNFYQISNQVTLGRSEEDLIDNLEKIISKFIDKETNMRQHIYQTNRDQFVDRIWRSMGLLQSARIITSDETIRLLSAIRLGVDMEIIPGLSRQLINELFISTQPGHLQKMEGKILSAGERDIKRAELIRRKLNVNP